MAESSFSAVDIIARKQSGAALTPEEIAWWVKGATRGEIPDYQTSAFLMAVFFRGMNVKETRYLTSAMIDSGRRLRLGTINGIKVDKHSTGGVGDKISLILGPLVASVGAHIPMISGRGLGHTGGTLDKLESIPGFRTGLKVRAFEGVVRKVGIAIIGQTDEIAPADRKFYAIRDVTSTVRCPPLMVGSILSKKIASGADAVVFDIKCGEGAFMRNAREGKNLAGLLIKVASTLALKVSAVLTRMEEPLGTCVGNALEVRESIEVLKGRFVEDLVDLSLTLGAEMLLLSGRARKRDEALRLLRTALLGGKALQKFREMVEAQGGDPRVVDDPGRLRVAGHTRTVKASKAGFVADIDALEVGKIAVALGAGRTRAEEDIDHSVGIEFLKKKGHRVAEGEPIAVVYAASAARGRRCAALLADAIRIAVRKPEPKRVIIGRVSSGRIEELPPV
jgi:pyrimidine-nucleoside phosphorylase